MPSDRAGYDPSTVSPQDCPDPSYHATFRYCPNCSWTEADDAAPCDSVCFMFDDSVGNKCEGYAGHAGDHFIVLKSRPKAELRWLGDDYPVEEQESEGAER